MTKQELLTWIDFDPDCGDPDWSRHWQALPRLCEKFGATEKLGWWLADRINPLHDSECVHFCHASRSRTTGYDPSIRITLQIDEPTEFSIVEFEYFGVERYVYLPDSHLPEFQEGDSKSGMSPVWQSVHGDVIVPTVAGFEHQFLLHDGALVIRCRDFNLFTR